MSGATYKQVKSTCFLLLLITIVCQERVAWYGQTNAMWKAFLLIGHWFVNLFLLSSYCDHSLSMLNTLSGVAFLLYWLRGARAIKLMDRISGMIEKGLLTIHYSLHKYGHYIYWGLALKGNFKVAYFFYSYTKILRILSSINDPHWSVINFFCTPLTTTRESDTDQLTHLHDVSPAITYLKWSAINQSRSIDLSIQSSPEPRVVVDSSAIRHWKFEVSTDHERSWIVQSPSSVDNITEPTLTATTLQFNDS